MEEATEYKKYLKGLERIEAKDQLDKATKKVKAMEAAKAADTESFLKRRIELAGKGALDYATKAAKASRIRKIAGAVAAAGIAGSAYLRSKMKDIKEKQKAEGKMGGGMMKKYSEGDFVKRRKELAGAGSLTEYLKTLGVFPLVNKKSMGGDTKLSPKQMKIARMAPPPNEITGDDFKAMKANVGKSVKGYGQARKSGMGLEDENISLGKGSDYIKDLL